MLLASSSSRAAVAAAPAAHRRTVLLLPRARPAMRNIVVARAEQQQKTSTPDLMRSGEETDNCEDSVAGEYCSIDLKGKRIKDRTLGEMEAEFLEALSSYYYDGKPKLSDEEFSLLKEELIWNGSKVREMWSRWGRRLGRGGGRPHRRARGRERGAAARERTRANLGGGARVAAARDGERRR